MLRRHAKHGITLVELLIVIAIIGVLIQLTIPAVQSAREAARRTECQNNLHQLGIATLSHESTHKYLPTAGWGWAWLGDPDRGAGTTQPGSWAYQLLPYLEEQFTYDIGRGLKGPAKYAAAAKLAATPVPLLYCPSRRPPMTTSNVGPRVNVPGFSGEELFWFNSDSPVQVAKMDYAANIGDRFVYWNAGPIPSDAEAGTGFFKFFSGQDEPTLADITGVVIQRQPFNMAHIIDGASNTYLLGEKYVPFAQYYTGRNLNDDQSCWNGDDLDTVASAGVVPRPDTASPVPGQAGFGVPFGSAHPGTLNMLYCDGSVRSIGYDIDPEVHRQSGNRRDSRTPKDEPGENP
jgi:prepilin-type N-terminal cleavage/methylation domain-containing protein/prepilin-type processing-associated H-X9-DG protein